MRGLKSGHPFNMQAFMYYRMRCVLAGDIARAWGKFGGLSGQLNLLGIVLRLAITESPYVSMEYDRITHQRLAALARDRYMGNNPGINFFTLLSNEQVEVTRNIVSASNAYLRNRPPPGTRRNDPNLPRASGDRGQNDNAQPKNVQTGALPPPASEVEGKYGFPKGGNKKEGQGRKPPQ